MDCGKILLAVIPLTAAHLPGLNVVRGRLLPVHPLMANGANAILEGPCDPAAGAIFILAGGVVLAYLAAIGVNPHAGNRGLIDHRLIPSMILRDSSVLQ